MPEHKTTAGGRPTKYDSRYCGEVVSCLAKGHSITAFAGEIGVHRATIFNWMEAHREFFDAVKDGQAKAVKFWEEKLIAMASDGKGNVTAVIFGLKNRAAEDWADRVVTEHSGPGGGPIETRDVNVRDIIASRLAGLTPAGSAATDSQGPDGQAG